ncbi:MAG: hypothetical protein DMG12_09665, partial [Acidobacteria bacterium]
METKTGETYQARIEVNRPAYAYIKITWNPDLAATVDGRPAPVIHVTPGFGAVPIPAGQHDISVEYKPGVLKPLLFVFGLAAFVLRWFRPGRLRVGGVGAIRRSTCWSQHSSHAIRRRTPADALQTAPQASKIKRA